MAIYYRFRSCYETDMLILNEPCIKVRTAKECIARSKRLNLGVNCELRLLDADTMDPFDDDDTELQRNRSVIVQRVPTGLKVEKCHPNQSESSRRLKRGFANNDENPDGLDEGGHMFPKALFAESEEERIKEAMNESSVLYNPKNYKKFRGMKPTGPVPLDYVCNRCGDSGHWINDCPVNSSRRFATGIPTSFMKPVSNPSTPGALIIPGGLLAVPRIVDDAYNTKKQEPLPFLPPTARALKPDKHKELRCIACTDFCKDAVRIKCCRVLFCDDCVRPALVENQTCPACLENNVKCSDLMPATRELTPFLLQEMHCAKPTEVGVLEMTTPSSSCTDDVIPIDQHGLAVCPSSLPCTYGHSRVLTERRHLRSTEHTHLSLAIEELRIKSERLKLELGLLKPPPPPLLPYVPSGGHHCRANYSHLSYPVHGYSDYR
ncbi:unnamed protein product [Notodromas monacha]|uniref:Uncharacterized protein n=1 Tax=Notodromas monacha TaxID=399045 RepID=A0A7R9GEU6_9CRUS|nr:unnamed protein product [Notodromas monacha]CAG0918220.1 unnamed protein product [Notodromas monacha]